jgi:DNA repair exonuclease SbcCD nuclease subunit
MKILCFTDNHFCERSSIVTKYGTKYSLRLENQLASINWVEQLAKDKGCSMVVCLGDFFDKPQLTDQEITALQDIQWAEDIPHYFLVGNHESEENDLQYSSTKVLEGENRHIIDKPELRYILDIELAFLPYVVESNKQPLEAYFPQNGLKLPRILFSHNDILGLQMGPVVSKIGFSAEEIEANCTCCLNGHLHNGQAVSSKILNLGNLTGKDFGEDATRYTHKVMIIDTDTFGFESFENPYAFNFYKIDISTETDLKQLETVKSNAVISIKCVDKYVEAVREKIAANPNIIDTRLILIKTFEENSDQPVDISDLAVDQCVKFAQCCREKLDNTPILEAELAEILK